MSDPAGDYSSRKFWLTFFVMYSAPVMLISGYIGQTMYQEMTLWALGLYFGANVTTRIGSAKYGQ